MEDKNIEKRICKKKKFDFKCKKENAINSLFEVEHFLCDLKKICNTGFKHFFIDKISVSIQNA